MSIRGRVGALTVLCALAAAACTPIVPGTGVPGTGVTVPVGAPSSSPTPKPTTPTPKPTSTPPAYPGSILQFGVTSASVTLLQQKLGVTPATGYFGSVTEAAVKSFQGAHGLVVDGQVGPQTWAAIFGGAPAPSTPKPPAYPTLIRQPGLGAKALVLVAKEAGKPYLWGAAGPNSFDCSGLTMYVYKQLGVLLQRSADQQYRTTLHVPYAQAQPGDLIFFYDNTGTVYHVGMYAGNGMMWDAPHTGTVVRYENVWYPNSVWVGVPGARLAG
jgi:cell wall-associated NlpC family hydrolase